MTYRSLVVHTMHTEPPLDQDERWYSHHFVPDGCQQMAIVWPTEGQLAMVAEEDGRSIMLDMTHESSGTFKDLMDADMPFSVRRGREEGTVTLTIRVDEDVA